MSDEIDNQCDEVNFDGLSLHGVTRGEWDPNDGQFSVLSTTLSDMSLEELHNYRMNEWKQLGGPDGGYKFSISPTPSEDVISSDLWRGYTCQYRLSPEGELYLEKYVYPLEGRSLLLEFFGKIEYMKEEDIPEELWLEYDEIVDTGGRPPDIVNEKLTGNFWLIFRKSFEGSNIYVPFINGKVVPDRNEWKYIPSLYDLTRLILRKKRQGDTLNTPPNQ